MSPLLRQTLEEKNARRKRLMGLPYEEKVRIVEQMMIATAKIKKAVDKEVTKDNPDWVGGADQALKRAALRARELAARTNTPVHVLRDGRMVRLRPTADDLMLREEPPASGAEQPE